MINEVPSTKTTVIDNDTREKKNVIKIKYNQDGKKEQTIMKSKNPEEN